MPSPRTLRVAATWLFLASGGAAEVACARPNPLYAAESGAAGTEDAEDPAWTEDPSDGSSGGSTTAASEGGASSGVAGASSGVAGALVLFATAPTNGSVGVEGSGVPAGIPGAAELCALVPSTPCSSAPVPLLFEELDETDDLMGSFEPDAPVLSVSGVRLAASLTDFLAGPLDATLTEASVVAPAVLGVWTGLDHDPDPDPDVSSNCSEWTSGNAERRGGVGVV